MPPGPAFNWFAVAASVADILSHAAQIKAAQVASRGAPLVVRARQDDAGGQRKRRKVVEVEEEEAEAERAVLRAGQRRQANRDETPRQNTPNVKLHSSSVDLSRDSERPTTLSALHTAHVRDLDLDTSPVPATLERPAEGGTVEPHTVADQHDSAHTQETQRSESPSDHATGLRAKRGADKLSEDVLGVETQSPITNPADAFMVRASCHTTISPVLTCSRRQGEGLYSWSLPKSLLHD